MSQSLLPLQGLTNPDSSPGSALATTLLPARSWYRDAHAHHLQIVKVRRDLQELVMLESPPQLWLGNPFSESAEACSPQPPPGSPRLMFTLSSPGLDIGHGITRGLPLSGSLLEGEKYTLCPRPHGGPSSQRRNPTPREGRQVFRVSQQKHSASKLTGVGREEQALPM